MAMHLSETFSIIEPSTTTLRSLHSILCILETIPRLLHHIFVLIGAHSPNYFISINTVHWMSEKLVIISKYFFWRNIGMVLYLPASLALALSILFLSGCSGLSELQAEQLLPHRADCMAMASWCYIAQVSLLPKNDDDDDWGKRPTHSHLWVQDPQWTPHRKKRRDSNGNGHYKVLDSIDFYLELRFYWFLPAQLVAYSYTQICRFFEGWVSLFFACILPRIFL